MAPLNVGTSIALELEIGLSLVVATAPDRLPEFARFIPADWQTEAAELSGGSGRWCEGFGVAAWLAGVLFEADYRTATLAIRQLTVADALERLIAATGLVPNPELSVAGQFADLFARWEADALKRLGIEYGPAEPRIQHRTEGLIQLTRYLSGGDLHSRFWYWLDRGYHEFYRAWRESQANQIEMQTNLAVTAIERDRERLNWLPPQNVLKTYPQFLEGLKRREYGLFLWAEPFGLCDHMFLFPDVLAVSFSEPGERFQEFRAEAEGVAVRLKALSDPTRLMILRLCRNFAMDNTEMANYLGVTRQTVSAHAQILREAGLIGTRQTGRSARHAVNQAAVRTLLRDLAAFVDLLPES